MTIICMYRLNKIQPVINLTVANKTRVLHEIDIHVYEYLHFTNDFKHQQNDRVYDHEFVIPPHIVHLTYDEMMYINTVAEVHILSSINELYNSTEQTIIADVPHRQTYRYYKEKRSRLDQYFDNITQEGTIPTRTYNSLVKAFGSMNGVEEHHPTIEEVLMTPRRTIKNMSGLGRTGFERIDEHLATWCELNGIDKSDYAFFNK